MELIKSWEEEKTVLEWLADFRCHPEMNYDSLRKRLKRGGPLSIPEMALTTPVIKGAQVGDTKLRVKERETKAVERYKGFVLAQKVRERYDKGVERSEIKERFDISENTLQKIISKQYFWNIHWDLPVGKVPDHFRDLKSKCEYIPGVTEEVHK
jgi:hypothetical protein